MMACFDPHSVCARCHDKKGTDPCVEKPDADCALCNALTPEQLTQLSTPSYKPKKEKKEAKSSTPSKEQAADTLSPTVVDPALVLLVGVVDGQSTSGLSGSAEKKKKADIKKYSKSVKSDKSVKSSSSRPLATSPTDQGKSTTSSTDSRISDLDKKWSDRFNRLEALLMAKTLDRPQDSTFSTVKVAPTHTPPANVVRTDPFLKPVTQPPQITDRPAVDSQTTNLPQHKSTAEATSSAQLEPTTAQTCQRQLSSAFDMSRMESSPSDSDSDSLSSDRPLLDIFPEEGELSEDQETNLSENDQSLSEEQSYLETMRGIRSYMGWNHIPDIDSGAITS